MIPSHCYVCSEKFEPGDRVTICRPPVGGDPEYFPLMPVWLCEVCADKMRGAFRERDIPYCNTDLDKVGPFSGKRGISLSGNSARGRGRKRGK